ncbi:aminoacyl-tRNA hydrolase [Patescibacteria group bacterium]|nr:aminoacyl-tRNA hydrolase [Patescibacteria group bacterium]
MKLIVGLGNPGEKYEDTKHNLGFVVLDALFQELTPVEKTAWKENKKFNSLLAKIGDLILAKPQTFMNASGMAVAKIANFYKIKLTDLWVIHDEIDLPLEEIRIVRGRGAAGHRGVESIIKELGTEDFVRFRLGIGHPGPGSGDKEVERYVLALFGKGEKSKARRMVKKTVKAIQLALNKGLERAMNQFK